MEKRRKEEQETSRWKTGEKETRGSKMEWEREEWRTQKGRRRGKPKTLEATEQEEEK